MSELDANVVAMLTRHRAVAYFHAALDIVPRNSALEPKYFTFSHSIELALKAYLMVNGHSINFCRKLKHDLKKVMQLAESHQLGLSEHNQAVIASLSEQHNRPFSFRYFNPDGWSGGEFPGTLFASRSPFATGRALQAIAGAATRLGCS